MSPNLSSAHLYAIIDTGYLQGRDPGRIASQMVEGGVDVIQIRAKDEDVSVVRDLSKAVIAAVSLQTVSVIINDFPEIAAEVGASGVHVGQDDLSVSAARELIGPGKYVGKSTHSLEQALAAEQEGADYIGVGPVFATPTKPTYKPVGLELVRSVASKVKLPFFCIGGIKVENASEVIRAGAQRLVVVSGILQAEDIVVYCRKIKELFSSKTSLVDSL
jgi:thiamine-phosphate pyrophosphorylase